MTTQNSVTRAFVITKALELENVWTPEEHEVLAKMLNSITAPRKKSDEPTMQQKINGNLANALVKAMEDYGEPVTAKWIQEHVPGIMTSQKVVAVVKAAGERIIKFYDRRNVFYKLA